MPEPTLTTEQQVAEIRADYGTGTTELHSRTEIGTLLAEVDRLSGRLASMTRSHARAASIACWVAGQPVVHEMAEEAGETVAALVSICPVDPDAPAVRPTRYAVSLLDETDVNYRVHTVQVEFRGRTLGDHAEIWIVEHNGAQLHPDGTWRDHDYYAWPDLPTALGAAYGGVYSAVVNGRTAVEARDIARARPAACQTDTTTQETSR